MLHPFTDTRRRITATVLGVTLLLPTLAAAATPDFGGYRPHYQGFGVETPAGRGGTVLRVTNLNDSGPGSLRAAMTAAVPRIVIFDISGTIVLNGPIYVTTPYLTVAGQTSPSPGINVRDWGIYIDTHDVVIQHLRMRYGDTGDRLAGNNYVLNVGTSGEQDNSRPPAYNVVFDHVSTAWTMYMAHATYNVEFARFGNGQTNGHPYNVSFLDCLFAYGLVKDIGNNGMGGGIGGPGYFYPADGNLDEHGMTIARSLYVHNGHRQPIFGTGRRIQLINSVVYGSGDTDVYEDDAMTMIEPLGNYDDANNGYRREAVLINNLYIPSLGTGTGITAGSVAGTKPFYFVFNAEQIAHQQNRIWLAGNQGPHITGATAAGQWAGVVKGRVLGGITYADADVAYPAEPAWQTAFHFDLIDPANVGAVVFAHAGSRPLDRDAVDDAAVAQVRAGLVGDTAHMGTRITTQNEMGGHITIATHVRALALPANPNAVAPGQTFRTNIEVWLEGLAQTVESNTQFALAAPQNVRIASSF